MVLFPRIVAARREARLRRNFELAQARVQIEARDRTIKDLHDKLCEYAATYECMVCGEKLSNTAVHRIVDTGGKSDEMVAAEGDGGTAMVAEFCQTHCPGVDS